MSIITPDILFTLVDTACGSNVSNTVSARQQEEAMNQLHVIENMDGFVSSIIQIMTSNAVRAECRLLSIILLKNVVGKRWAPRGGKYTVIGQEEKGLVKHYVLQTNHESDKRILSQLAIVISKIARHDWPDHWSELFPALFASLQSVDNQVLYNSSVCLLEVITELSTKTLSFAKSAFSSLCLELFPMISSLWTNHQNQLIFQLNSIKQIIEGNSVTNDIPKIEILFTIDYVSVMSKLLLKLLENALNEINLSVFLVTYFTTLSNSLQRIMSFFRQIRVLLYKLGIKVSDYYNATTMDISSSMNESNSNGNSNGNSSGNSNNSNNSSSNSHNSNLLSPPQSKSSEVIEILIVLRPYITILSQQQVILQKSFPLDMVPYLPGFVTFYYDQLLLECSSSVECNQRVDGCFTVSAIIFLSNYLSCIVYSPEVIIKEVANMQSSPVGNVARLANKLSKGGKPGLIDDNITAQTAYDLRISFFDNNRLLQLLQVSINHLLRYSEVELQEWVDDPEHFFLNQSSLTANDSIKTAAEHLFLSMIDFNSSAIIPYLVNLLMDTPRQLLCVSGSVNDEEIELWDAVYLCVGIGSSTIGQQINASEWLTNSLGKIVQETLIAPNRGSLKQGEQLLRHRFLWLLSSWMYYWDASVVEVLTQILVSTFEQSSRSDLVVKLSSLQALESLLRSENFSAVYLLPLLQRLVEALCRLIQEVEDNDTKARVVELFGEIALAMKLHLGPVLSPLVGYLGNIWSASDDKSPLRRSILEVLTVIVKEAKSSASTLCPVAMPLIHFAITGAESLRNSHNNISSSTSAENMNNINDENSSYLLEEGIHLWLALSRNTSIPTNEANQLLNLSLNTLFKDNGSAGDMDVDGLKDILMVVEAHAVIGQLSCLQSSADMIKLLYDKLFGQVAARVVPYLMRPIEAFALSCPREVALFTYQSGILRSMLRACCAYIPGLEESMKEYLEPEIAIVSYLSFIARILLSDANTLTLVATNVVDELISRGVTPVGTGVEVLLRSIVRTMIDMFDMVSSCSAGMWRRKLWVLALLSLYPTTDDILLNWFSEILNMVDSVICEEMDEQNSSPTKYSVAMATSMVALSTEDAAFVGGNNVVDVDVEPVAACMGMLIGNDIVHQSSLIAIASEKMRGIRLLIGDVRSSELLQSLAPSTLSRLIS